MSNLSQILADSNWGQESARINQNFQNINTDLEKVKSATTKFKGYFTTEESLTDKIASPKIGDTAWVGEPYPGTVYDVQTDGQWHNTGKAPDTGSVDLQDYAKKEELTELENNISIRKLSKNISSNDSKIDIPLQKIVGIKLFAKIESINIENIVTITSYIRNDSSNRPLEIIDKGTYYEVSTEYIQEDLNENRDTFRIYFNKISSSLDITITLQAIQPDTVTKEELDTSQSEQNININNLQSFSQCYAFLTISDEKYPILNTTEYKLTIKAGTNIYAPNIGNIYIDSDIIISNTESPNWQIHYIIINSLKEIRLSRVTNKINLKSDETIIALVRWYDDIYKIIVDKYYLNSNLINNKGIYIENLVTKKDLNDEVNKINNTLYPYKVRLLVSQGDNDDFPIEINTVNKEVILKGFRLQGNNNLSSIVNVSDINIKTQFYNNTEVINNAIYGLYIAYKSQSDVFATIVIYSDLNNFISEYSSYTIYEIGRGYLFGKGKYFINCISNFIFDGIKYYISNGKIPTKNSGKSIGVFGGSLSVYSESETAKNIWRSILDAEVTSYGVAGAGFSSLQGTSIQQQVDNAAVHDIYVLWASTNDYTNNRECGDWSDYTEIDSYDESKLITQCGGINYAIKKLLEKNPKAEIYFFTSLRFFYNESGYNPFSNNTNSTGKTFADYVEAQKKCCEYYSIPVLDQFNIQGANIFNYEQYYKSDKLHMNEEGYAKIGYQQAYFLMNGK